MPGVSTTGQPSTRNYLLGRGAVYFASLESNGLPLYYRHLGNAPAFNMTNETETLEHQASLSGLKVVDKEAILSQKVSVSFTLDEIMNFANLADFFSGTTGSFNNQEAQDGVTDETQIADGVGNIQALKWYDMIGSAGGRLYDVGAVTLKTTEDTPITLVKGTDYEEDLITGRFFLHNSPAIQTALAANKGIELTTAANGSAVDPDTVEALSQTSVVGALKFISENAADNDVKTEYLFHKISLKSEGDLGAISDEFAEMGFTAAAEKNINDQTLTITYPQTSL